MKTVSHSIGLAALLLASCASDKSSETKSAPAFKPFSQRLAEDQQNGGKAAYKKDANGNWVPQENKRSEFESKGQSPYFKGDYAAKQYKAGEYAKKSWWGNKDYQPKQYDGNTDGSRFQTTSRFDGEGARESGTAAKLPDPYQTGAYATGDAREAGKSRIGKTNATEADRDRKNYPEPEIIDWREQRAMSLQQSKGILGR